MPQIEVAGLVKRFGSQAAVDGIEFFIPDGSFTTLLGPSGCGKTTTLRMLAGFERPDEGVIRIGDRVVAGGSGSDRFVPPQERGLGVVFQSYALWPHMNVFDQIAYPLRAHRAPRASIRPRVEAMLELVRLPHAADLLPSELSGGQQQRVALARALVIEPAVLLLDEPMSNLDAALRAQMRDELSELHSRVAVTTVYVTHDQGEALALSDQIMVMRAGRIVESGSATSIYDRPRTRYGAEFVGHSNCLQATVQSVDGTGLRAALANGRTLELNAPAGELNTMNAMVLGIKPEDVRVLTPESAGALAINCLAAQVRQCTFLGARTEVLVDCEGVALRASVPGLRGLRAGASIHVSLPRDALFVVQADT